MKISKIIEDIDYQGNKDKVLKRKAKKPASIRLSPNIRESTIDTLRNELEKGRAYKDIPRELAGAHTPKWAGTRREREED